MAHVQPSGPLHFLSKHKASLKNLQHAEQQDQQAEVQQSKGNRGKLGLQHWSLLLPEDASSTDTHSIWLSS